MIKRTLVALALAASFPVYLSYAQPPMPRSGMDKNNTDTNNVDSMSDTNGWHQSMEKHFENLSRKLNLTEDQKPKVKAICQALHESIMDAKTNALSELQSVLTPEQYQKVEKMMKNKHHMRRHGEMNEGNDNDQDDQ